MKNILVLRLGGWFLCNREQFVQFESLCLGLTFSPWSRSARCEEPMVVFSLIRNRPHGASQLVPEVCGV